MEREKDIRIGILNDYYGSMLTDYQREMVRLYYDRDLSLAEIAEQYGVSRQAVREVLVRSRQKLLEWEDRLHLLAKLASVADKIEALIDRTDDPVLTTALQAILAEVKDI
ncbi:MAG TPA: helix-turn-helix domain-containing protein [Candidatus Stercoripulliclostridium merdipullorum]|uniref:UPF0122 protein IAB14_05040 n=1 Tax=Candidatus Stercoripulliclostridium merdipullorum TaxID=2840952 RepID=A0A9D1SXR8_9FIRM|nr:helix-turn-helix domain-containing protein [Candidatus Stercoripulliclostridium merdipullorum]